MESLHQEGKHLLGVMLGEALELHSSLSYNIFYIPGCDVRVLPSPKILQQLSVGNGELSFCSQGVLGVDVVGEDVI